jgi:hypothetical protein
MECNLAMKLRMVIDYTENPPAQRRRIDDKKGITGLPGKRKQLSEQ